jgi:hypothetical protein
VHSTPNNKQQTINTKPQTVNPKPQTKKVKMKKTFPYLPFALFALVILSING